MRWYSINDDYLTYLRSYEGRIPYIDYGANKFKPFFGALFEIGDFVYVTQVSSPKKRHCRMRENVDFYKLYRGKNLKSVVNLNYMFPVPKSMLIDVNYGEIENFRSFKDADEKAYYIGLLKFELREINKKKINEKAKDLYYMKYDYPNDTVSQRCFDFKQLESKASEYLL